MTGCKKAAVLTEGVFHAIGAFLHRLRAVEQPAQYLESLICSIIMRMVPVLNGKIQFTTGKIPGKTPERIYFSGHFWLIFRVNSGLSD